MLDIVSVSKTFAKGSINENHILTDFSLSIGDGEFVTVVGSNGSGKTTILNIICGSIPADSGQVILGDMDITNMPQYRRANFIGRVFQDPSMGTCPGMTILENMSMADNKGKFFGITGGINKKRIDFYKTLLSRLKLGLEDKINDKAGTLSGGQRQALTLLIATMTPISLLILDEHTAALDPAACETVMELTNEIVREKKITTVMVTHNLKYAVSYGDRILMMHKGSTVLDEKANKGDVDVKRLLDIFNSISIELGNSL